MGDLFKIANEEYYIDLDKISDFIRIEPTIDEILEPRYKIKGPNKDEIIDEKIDEKDSVETQNNYVMVPPHTMMDVAKWEVVRALLESLLNENGMVDESMGIKKLETQLSIPFRISFNTLLKNKLIKKNG
mgnify:CR=1 FL=1